MNGVNQNCMISVMRIQLKMCAHQTVAVQTRSLWEYWTLLGQAYVWPPRWPHVWMLSAASAVNWAHHRPYLTCLRHPCHRSWRTSWTISWAATDPTHRTKIYWWRPMNWTPENRANPCAIRIKGWDLSSSLNKVM